MALHKSFSTVQEVLDNYKTSVYEKDVEQFLASFAPDIHVFDCWENWESTGIAALRDMAEGWFGGLRNDQELLKVSFNDVVIQENAELAFVHCAVTLEAYNASGDKLRGITNRFTFGLRKIEDSWAITHEHSSLPVRMETGKAIFDLR